MLKGYKTYIVNGVLFLGAAIAWIAPGADAPTPEAAEAAGIAVEKAVDSATELWTMGLTFGNMLLRAITTGPAGLLISRLWKRKGT